MAMHFNIIGGDSDGLFVMLNGKFCTAKFIQRQPQLVFVETPMTAGLPQRVREGWLSSIPLGRAGQPEDVARLVAFVLSHEAAYLTGQTLVLDGGMSA